MHLFGWDLVSLLLCLCKRWAKRTNPGCFWHPLLIMNYLVSFKRSEKGGTLLEELRKSPSSHFLCSVISDEKPWLRKAILKESVSPWQCPEGYIHGPLSEDIVVFGQAWLWRQTGTRYTYYIWQSLKEQNLPDLSFLWLSDKDWGNHPSDPSYRTSVPKNTDLLQVIARFHF